MQGNLQFANTVNNFYIELCTLPYRNNVGQLVFYLHGTSLTKLPLKACKPSWVTGISICYKSHQNIAESVQATYLLSHGIRRISPPSAVSEELIQLQNLHTQKSLTNLPLLLPSISITNLPLQCKPSLT
jgi:hypothetical protein